MREIALCINNGSIVIWCKDEVKRDIFVKLYKRLGLTPSRNNYPPELRYTEEPSIIDKIIQVISEDYKPVLF